MDYKKTNAESTTVTRDLRMLDVKTGNIYESIAILAKRANQMPWLTTRKLGDFPR